MVKILCVQHYSKGFSPSPWANGHARGMRQDKKQRDEKKN